MARLPIPGSDNDTWGDVLNGFLGVAHNADGSLQTSAVKQAGGVISVNTITPQANGNVTLSPANIGAVQLGGDLGGTNSSPTVTNTHLASALPVNQGGTGSTIQNFVDLSTDQTKTGTLTVLMQDKGGQVFNVKAYGAAGNGSTDDTSVLSR